MILEDAYQFLGLTANSTESERFAMYEDTRNKLEAKLAKAPTPGLKEKYRKTIRELDEAIEAIENSVDGGDLPTLTRSADIPPIEEPALAPPPETQQASRPAPRAARKSHKGEMTVAAVVIGIMIAGGWMYFNNQNQQSAVKNDLPQLRENIERAQQEMRNLDSQSAELGIALGEDFQALVSGDTSAELNGHLQTAERYGSMEEWGAAATEMELAENGLKAFNQSMMQSASLFDTESAALLDYAIEIYPNGSKSQMLLALSSGNKIDVNKTNGHGHAFHHKAYVAGLDEYPYGMSPADALAVAERLLQMPEVDVNIKNDQGETFLGAVIEGMGTYTNNRNLKRLANLLIDRPDVDVNARGNNGYSLLHGIVLAGGDVDILSKLLSHPDINVNVKDDSGKTLLIFASKLRYAEVVRRLLAHPNIALYEVDHNGSSALQRAEERWYEPFSGTWSEPNPQIVRMLKQAMGQ